MIKNIKLVVNTYIKELKKAYYKWLNSSISFSYLKGGYLSVNTLLNGDYDSVHLYIKLEKDNKIRVSDFGSTLFRLNLSGANISKGYRVRWSIFKNILTQFKVNYNDKYQTLYIDTTINKFPIARLRLSKAILHIQDIEYLSRKNIHKSFNDYIRNYLRDNHFKYCPAPRKSDNNVPIHFNFAIPSYTQTHKFVYKLVKSVSRPNDINQAKVFNYDVKYARYRHSCCFILLINDIKKGNNNKRETVDPIMKEIALNNLDRNVVSTYKYSEVQHNNRILSNTCY